MKKRYVVDTNVLLDNYESITILRNGEENEIFIPLQVILELDNLKKEPRLSYIVSKVVDEIIKNREFINIVFTEEDKKSFLYNRNNDINILNEAKTIENGILVTNDKILRLLCSVFEIPCEKFLESIPFKTESEEYTGFTKEGEDIIKNSFRWEEGIPVFYNNKLEPTKIRFDMTPWKITPKSVYQNLAMYLMMNENINLVSIQGKSGFGKTHASLSCAFDQVLQKKKYSKIYFIKPFIEIGAGMGFLPGTLSEKMEPYVSYLRKLIMKLHEIRACNRIFANDKFELDPNVFEILNIGYIRGMNIDDAFVIIDECQNISRTEIRSILTRMGDNVKCVMLGDVNQVDNRFLNNQNNAMNWCLKHFKNEEGYAHIVMNGNKSRGNICDLVLKTGL